ncbi:hypothetical protein ILYODFUR_030842 [Ilyodon furcidens]|uniref:Secreted protein n=1 Tax=Ilyodon furcidens TaxID=33524 RepID=A0ABV0UMR1_9TELE
MMMSVAIVFMVVFNTPTFLKKSAAISSLAFDCSKYQSFSHSDWCEKAEELMHSSPWKCTPKYTCLFVPLSWDKICLSTIISSPPVGSALLSSYVCCTFFSPFCFGHFIKSNLFIQETSTVKC